MSKDRRSDGFGNKGKYKSRSKTCGDYKVGAQAQETLSKIDEGCVTIQNFRKYAEELDRRRDKFERIVKLSRDITIESKRIIFLLHTIDQESKKASVLNEADSRLEALVSHHLKSIAEELDGEDPYLYHRAFSCGMQEFMEAFMYYDYLKNEKFYHWDHYQNKLKYQVKDKQNAGEHIEGGVCKKEIITLLVPVDFILGLADVTGELMRKCINNLGSGNVENCFETCDFVKNIYCGFLTVGFFGNREMSHKLFTLRQSLLKMEMVCYNIHVRGSEVPKHMLADVEVPKTYTDDDEGFFN